MTYEKPLERLVRLMRAAEKSQICYSEYQRLREREQRAAECWQEWVDIRAAAKFQSDIESCYLEDETGVVNYLKHRALT